MTVSLIKRSLILPIMFLVFVACTSDEPSLKRFDSLREEGTKAAEKMMASSYLYRIDITPEEQEMQSVMKSARSGSGGSQVLVRGLGIEQTRREKYIEPFEADIETLRKGTVQLTEVAQTLHDADLRSAALKVSAHYGRLVELGAGLAAAQRTRSVFTEKFLNALVDRSITGRLNVGASSSELGRADEQANQNRTEIEKLYPEEAVLYAEFKGVRQRKKATFFGQE